LDGAPHPAVTKFLQRKQFERKEKSMDAIHTFSPKHRSNLNVEN